MAYPHRAQPDSPTMRSTTSLALVASLALLTAACGVLGGGKRVSGTGPLVTDNRRLTPIDEIVLEAGVDLIVIRGDQQTVNVSAQDEIQPLLKTEVDNGKLTVSIDGDVDMDGGTNVELVLTELASLKIESSGNVSVRGFRGDKLKLASEGSGNLAALELDYDDLDLSTGGSGDIDLAGAADDVTIALTASGDVDAYDLAAKKVKVTSKGSGDVRVNVSDDLDAEVKGSGSVYYRGNPEMKIKDEGSGSVTAE